MGTLFAVFARFVFFADLRVFVIHTPLAPRERESTLLDELFRAAEELMTGAGVRGGGFGPRSREGSRRREGGARSARSEALPLDTVNRAEAMGTLSRSSRLCSSRIFVSS